MNFILCNIMIVVIEGTLYEVFVLYWLKIALCLYICTFDCQYILYLHL